MPNALETSIEYINKATNVEQAFARFHEIMSSYGYKKVAYSLITDHPSLSLPKQHGLASSYPDDWMKHYANENYLEDDAVVVGMMHYKTPFFWSDLESIPDINPKSLEILRQGNDAGVKAGIAIPMQGVGGELVGVGLAKDEDEKSNDYDFLAKAYLLTSFFHQKFRSLLMQKEKFSYSLNQKELDILSWAAEGKTDEEIAMICNLSARNVRYYWTKIFTQLDVNGRIFAITKALALGIIQPRVAIRTVQPYSCSK